MAVIGFSQDSGSIRGKKKHTNDRPLKEGREGRKQGPGHRNRVGSIGPKTKAKQPKKEEKGKE